MNGLWVGATSSALDGVVVVRARTRPRLTLKGARRPGAAVVRVRPDRGVVVSGVSVAVVVGLRAPGRTKLLYFLVGIALVVGCSSRVLRCPKFSSSTVFAGIGVVSDGKPGGVCGSC